jgi:arylsulfatase A-like enzyme
MKSFIGVHRCHRWLKNKLPLACVFMLMAVTMAQAVEQKQPNIILILADDLGYGDLSLHGSTVIETPHLDRLGAESMQFRNFSVHPACAPTRASLLTGRHHLRTGVWGVHGGTDFMNLDELTIAEVLKEAGYETGMWGKWHSGKTDGYYPWDRGFDEAYYAQLYRYRDNEGLLNGKPHTLKGWTCERLTDMAIEFIQKERDQPFFAYLPYLTPHGIWDAPPEEIEYYTKKGLSKEFATLAGMISFMDKNIQRLLTAVDDQGLRENTIILFMSDNGPISGHGKKRWITEEEKRQRNAPLNLRGGKGTLWQNGIRSPLFIRWPRVVKPGICDQADYGDGYFPHPRRTQPGEAA